MTLASLWRQQRSLDADPAASTGDGGETPVTGAWDVVVVGAGITGLSTAALLGRAGLSVLVLEGRRVGDGTTGRSTAKVSLLQGTQLSRIAARQSLEVVRDYVAANRAAQDWVAEVCAAHGVEAQRRTAYTYATTASGESSARRELHHAQAAGLPVAWVDDPGVGLPYETRGAIALPDQLQTDPLELLHALRSVVLSQGGAVAEHARVTGVRGRRPIRVTTARGAATARTVVIATNSPILDRGAHFARVSPARSYSVAFRTPAPAVGGMYLSTDQPSRSLRDAVDADGAPLLLVGGEGHTTGRESSAAARLDRLRDWTHEHFAGAEEVAAWSAQDYLPHHGLPWAGPLVPRRDDLLFAGGFSKWGMTNGVAAAHVLAARIASTGLPEWSGVFDTYSGEQVSGLTTAGRLNAEVGLALTAGWVAPLRRSASPAPAEGDGHVGRSGLATPTAVSTSDGVTRRVSAVCTHLGGVVSWNDAERSWDCPLHGSRFDADGEVLEGVATCGLTHRS